MSMNLAGSVYDELGNPINGATVAVKNEAGATVGSTTTSPTGTWGVTTLTATDAHTVEITLAGSQVRKVWGDIKVQVGEIVVVDKFELAAGGVLVLPAAALAAGVLSSGEYYPTITGVMNVEGVTPLLCYWHRIGNFVFVAGRANIDPSGAGGYKSEFRISLPVASNLTDTFSGAGMTSGQGDDGTAGGLIQATAATHDMTAWYFPASSANQSVPFTFVYKIIV